MCPTAELAVFTLDATSAGVRGCGRQARYVLGCQRVRGEQDPHCEWVRQGEVMSVEQVIDSAPPREMSQLLR